MTERAKATAVETHDGQPNSSSRSYHPQQIPSIRELHPATVRAIADAALRLFEALEEGSCPALGSTVEPRGWKTSGEAASSSAYGLNWRLDLFRERIVAELLRPALPAQAGRFDPQPPAAESAASTPAEAREKVSAGDEVLVDTTVYSQAPDGENWCRVIRVSEGDAVVYPIKAVSLDGRGRLPAGGRSPAGGEMQFCAADIRAVRPVLADRWRGEFDEPAEAFGGEEVPS